MEEKLDTIIDLLRSNYEMAEKIHKRLGNIYDDMPADKSSELIEEKIVDIAFNSEKIASIVSDLNNKV
ncbi:hypothetical protein EIB71_01775 [Kaistella daneshvariae]|uniref:Uncharacterized protein n=1 Tax=Kaistella daneshvariae TaxID=2487074 RepID=A0ABM7C6A5_9FLAO|nr:hypothetical protein [Kaistella daneshvariae]AZI66483.1 hypothetical protein EIB71_01775 [Kaistella daneshvariae]